MDFPIWFNFGNYSGLACCILAAGANALYATRYRRGTTRQLVVTLAICIISALLLIPALVWYSLRFRAQMAMISIAEVEVMLAYTALFGWIIPLSSICTYILFSQAHTATTPVPPSHQQQIIFSNSITSLQPPRYQKGVLAPFVFDEDTPWGWLEYRSGSFHGQRLELKRAVVTIGRDEDSDIWIDDEMASRHHVELAWAQGNIYITDCESLNGVLLNGKPVIGSALLDSDDVLEIGVHCFIFIRAEHRQTSDEQDDPLLNHKWLSRRETLPPEGSGLPMTSPLADIPDQLSVASDNSPSEKIQWGQTVQTDHAFPLPVRTNQGATLTICNGEMIGQSFPLNRPIITVGRAAQCDIVINHFSISRQHLQLAHQPEGDYVQDVGSRNGTKVNDETLVSPRLLKPGDIICLGNTYYMQYATGQITYPTSPTTTPLSLTRSGPALLRLPSKHKG